MRKFALFAFVLLCTSVDAKPSITQTQALQIFKAGQYTGKFNPKNLTSTSCEMLDNIVLNTKVRHVNKPLGFCC